MAYKILIADDDQMSRKVMSLILSNDKNSVYSVVECCDGIEAWEKIQTELPDLVLLDWQMPGLSGLEVTKLIKKNYKVISVIIVTGKITSEDLRLALENGANDYIKKPIDKIELLARTKSALNLHDSLEEVEFKNKRILSQIDDLNKLSLIVRQTANSVLIFTPDGELEWANEGFHNMYGYTFGEFVQKYGTNISSISFNSQINSKIEELFETKHSVSYTTKCRVKYGATKWIQTTLTPIFDGKRIEKFIAIETDISQQKRTELELIKRNEETRKLIQEVQKANLELERQRLEILEKNRMIEEESQKADKLLLNILPQYVVSQLKTYGSSMPRNYKMASVMFTDFQGFTKSCENLTPFQIVDALHFFFSKFDDIINCHFIEKIKTIGDSYMCVGGIPLRNKSNPIDVILAALEIKKFMSTYREKYANLNLPDWNLRIGIHTGALIAGMVGKIKFAYDTWGDSVNVAKRIESADEIGCINISSVTYKYVKDYFVCRYRGSVEIKNHKDIDMYFVDRLLPEYSLDDEGYYPNDKFLEILNSI
ncbi:MAG: response regulator [Bacteroidales bacterium]|nr:response regulator [Bacteroidales bacterium]